MVLNEIGSPVVCEETGVTYDNCEDAAKAYNLTAYQVMIAANSISDNEAANVHWCWLSDAQNPSMRVQMREKEKAKQRKAQEAYQTMMEKVEQKKAEYRISHMNISGKPVYCYETDEVFGSQTEALNAKGLNKSRLNQAVRSFGRNTSGGYHWFYL